MKLDLMKLLSVLILLSLLIPSIHANVITVGPEGYDFENLQDAINASHAGDKVIIYNDLINNKVNISKPLQFEIYGIVAKEKSDGFDPAFSTIIASIIGALAAIVGGWLSNQYEISKRKYEKEAEREKWKRDLLQNIYSNCIDNLSDSTKEITKSIKWLETLMIYHPEVIPKLTQKVNELKKAQVDEIRAKKMEALSDVLDIAANDRELHNNQNIKPTV